MSDQNGTRRWGAKPALIIGLSFAALGCVAWVVLATVPLDRLLAGMAALVLGSAALIAWGWRRRLTADTVGLAVGGLLGPRRVPWAGVRTISAPTRTRRGWTSTSLEIDLEDGGLILLSRTELGADPNEVAGELLALRSP